MQPLPTAFAGALALAVLTLAGCTDRGAENVANAIASPITAPVNALVNNSMPLPSDTQYTYWYKNPQTGLYDSYVSDRPLTKEEQAQLSVSDKPAR